MLKSVLIFLFIVFLALLQVSFLPLFSFLSKLNLVLAAVVFMSVANRSLALKWAFAGGMILDLNSSFPFGAITLILLAVAMAASSLADDFFTNKSVYSLMILMVMGILAYDFGLWGVGRLSFWLKDAAYAVYIGKDFLAGLFWQLLSNSALVSLAYLAFRKVKFSPGGPISR